MSVVFNRPFNPFRTLGSILGFGQNPAPKERPVAPPNSKYGWRRTTEGRGYRNGSLAPAGMSVCRMLGRHFAYLAVDGQLRVARVGKPYRVAPAKF